MINHDHINLTCLWNSNFNGDTCKKVSHIYFDACSVVWQSSSLHSQSKCELTWASNSSWGTSSANFSWHIGQIENGSSSWDAMCCASCESESKTALQREHGLCGSPRASTNLQPTTLSISGKLTRILFASVSTNTGKIHYKPWKWLLLTGNDS